MFLDNKEKKISEEYINNGFVIRPVADQAVLDWIQSCFEEQSKKILKVVSEKKTSSWLNFIHDHVPVNQLNNFRLKMIEFMNANSEFRKKYYQLARPYLESLVGNELAMQRRINLSIQMPDDDSSLLTVHADTWSGDSPYEVVVWLPLVDCYKTKAMYLLPPLADKKLKEDFIQFSSSSSEELFRRIEKEVIWIEIKAGEVLIFNQNLPHGNRINHETETRWSMNCRFKGIFTPYGDKKIGEFFEPITLKAASRTGMTYRFPQLPSKNN